MLVIDSKQDENNTMIPSKEGPSGDPNFCQVLDIELEDDDSGIIPLTGSVIPKSEVESDESVSEKAKRLEIEKLKKGNVAFMPLEEEDEHQGTTEQQLPQVSVDPFKAQSYDPDMRREGGEDEEEMNEEQVENTSSCLDDTDSQEELPDATEHNETGMEGNSEKKDKSVRRRLFRWVNDKAKNYYSDKIVRTIMREEEEGKSVYQPCEISNFFYVISHMPD